MGSPALLILLANSRPSPISRGLGRMSSPGGGNPQGPTLRANSPAVSLLVKRGRFREAPPTKGLKNQGDALAGGPRSPKVRKSHLPGNLSRPGPGRYNGSPSSGT